MVKPRTLIGTDPIRIDSNTNQIVNFISEPHANLFELINVGKGISNDLMIYICQDLQFKDSESIFDGPMQMAPGESFVLNRNAFYSRQDHNRIDWFQNFYVKIVSVSEYSSWKFENIYKAEVQTGLPELNVELTQNVADIKTEETVPQTQNYKFQAKRVSFIHNFIPVSFNKNQLN